MAIKTTIARGANGLPKNTRKAVKPHAIFQVMKDGRPTGPLFANIGYSPSMGRFYSVALQGAKTGKNGALFGSSKGASNVTLVGTFEFELDLYRPGKTIGTSRNRLEGGDVFQVPGSAEANARKGYKPPLYVHLGTIANGKKVLSYNLNTKKIAIGSKLVGKVTKVGEATIAKTLVA